VLFIVTVCPYGDESTCPCPRNRTLSSYPQAPRQTQDDDDELFDEDELLNDDKLRLEEELDEKEFELYEELLELKLSILDELDELELLDDSPYAAVGDINPVAITPLDIYNGSPTISAAAMPLTIRTSSILDASIKPG
jgi:hypothetical protein